MLGLDRRHPQGSQNRFALIFRTSQMKTEAGRRKKIADLVAMLARGETPHPQKKGLEEG